MLKAKTVSQRITMLSGNKKVAEYVHWLAELEGIAKCKVEPDETIELKTDKVCVTITTDTMTAINVYGTVFEDLTKKDCKLKVLQDKRKVQYDKKNRKR